LRLEHAQVQLPVMALSQLPLLRHVRRGEVAFTAMKPGWQAP